MQEKSETIHPRPQLSRAQWLDLGGTWGFTYDDTNCGQDEKWQEREDVFTRTIQVPFPPESAASGIGDTNFHPIVWYRRTFQVPDEYASKRLLLHCGAVDYSTQVWVNGQLVAVHEGGQTPFTADITSVLRPEGEQVVVIRGQHHRSILTLSGIIARQASGNPSGLNQFLLRISHKYVGYLTWIKGCSR